MARFRRAAVIASLIGVGSFVLAQSGPAQPKLTVGPGIGILTINNASDARIDIDRSIAVERSVGTGWIRVATKFDAVAVCSGEEGTKLVALAPHHSIHVQPWTGFSCSSQCPGPCRHNLYLGPGPFRFVVTVLPSHTQISSSVFRMPARPPE